jgi:hypothetical protein
LLPHTHRARLPTKTVESAPRLVVLRLVTYQARKSISQDRLRVVPASSHTCTAQTCHKTAEEGPGSGGEGLAHPSDLAVPPQTTARDSTAAASRSRTPSGRRAEAGPAARDGLRGLGHTRTRRCRRRRTRRAPPPPAQATPLDQVDDGLRGRGVGGGGGRRDDGIAHIIGEVAAAQCRDAPLEGRHGRDISHGTVCQRAQHEAAAAVDAARWVAVGDGEAPLPHPYTAMHVPRGRLHHAHCHPHPNKASERGIRRGRGGGGGGAGGGGGGGGGGGRGLC